MCDLLDDSVLITTTERERIRWFVLPIDELKCQNGAALIGARLLTPRMLRTMSSGIESHEMPLPWRSRISPTRRSFGSSLWRRRTTVNEWLDKSEDVEDGAQHLETSNYKTSEWRTTSRRRETIRRQNGAQHQKRRAAAAAKRQAQLLDDGDDEHSRNQKRRAAAAAAAKRQAQLLDDDDDDDSVAKAKESGGQFDGGT